MITIKQVWQEYNIGWKDEEEIGEEEVYYNEYESLDDYVMERVIGEIVSHEQLVNDCSEEDVEIIENSIAEILEEIESDGGHWEVTDIEYYGRPEPHDGYAKTGSYCTISIVDKSSAKKEELERLNEKKEQLEQELKLVNNKLSELV